MSKDEALLSTRNEFKDASKEDLTNKKASCDISNQVFPCQNYLNVRIGFKNYKSCVLLKYFV